MSWLSQDKSKYWVVCGPAACLLWQCCDSGSCRHSTAAAVLAAHRQLEAGLLAGSNSPAMTLPGALDRATLSDASQVDKLQVHHCGNLS